MASTVAGNRNLVLRPQRESTMPLKGQGNLPRPHSKNRNLV